MAATRIEFRLERELQFRIGGEQFAGKLYVGDVAWLEDKQQWACHFSMDVVHPEIAKLYGSDPLAAVVKTLDFLSILIRGSEDDGLIVWWRTEGDHGGLTFPLSEGKSWQKIPSKFR